MTAGPRARRCAGTHDRPRVYLTGSTSPVACGWPPARWPRRHPHRPGLPGLGARPDQAVLAVHRAGDELHTPSTQAGAQPAPRRPGVARLSELVSEISNTPTNQDRSNIQ